MNTSRQTIVSPDQIPKHTFVIGDISLSIPPTQIEITKSDLVYQYRTLRTRGATKIPSGQGQISIDISVVFTNDQLLQLHRLLVEIRQNPFVYVDNRFVRESIVPDWPYAQQIAFTITGVSVSNLPNTVDAWQMNLSALWFCYFPFGHNFLFREDWVTNHLRSEIEGDKTLQSFTIGWYLDSEGKRQYYPNPIEDVLINGSQSLLQGETGIPATDKWSVSQGKFLNTERQRTIYDMEAAHPGAEFDLLPLPGNMRPANIVQQPIHSRIFVRYYNFLQRDALQIGFGIDVRADILEWEDLHKSPGLYDSLFRVGTDSDGLPTVIPLCSDLVPKELRDKWIKQMVSFNHGVRFCFHNFKEIRLPQKWTDNLANKRNNVVQDLFGRLQAAQNLGAIQRGDPTGDPRTIPVLGAQFPIQGEGSQFGWRNHPVTGQRQFHNGVDIQAPRGTPIIAPEGGQIVVAATGHTYNGTYIILSTDSGQWSFCHLDLLATSVGAKVSVGQVIGYVGNTGRTSAIQPNGTRDETRGYHLHLMYARAPSTEPENPLLKLGELLGEASSEILPTNESDTEFDYLFPPQSDNRDPLLENQDQLIELSRQQAKEALELTEEETNALQELLETLASEGWSYYDADTTVTNVWKKLFTLEIANSGLDRVTGRNEFPEEFKNAGIILTNVSGSLSHLVANIPVLSHEFPTQQHLGSIEPEYAMEFAVLDNQTDLEGISGMAQLVQGMRSMLQSNSRRFRPVLDGWCVATDTFITRLFGTYRQNDYRTLKIDGFYADAQLKKRSIICSSHEGTVPGNPGLSTIAFNLQETNPYETEELVSTSSTLQDKEASRAEVLQATHSLKLDPKYKDLLAPLFLAQKLGANLSDTEAADFGKFSIKNAAGFNYLAPQLTNPADVFSYLGADGEQKLLLRQSSPNDLNALKSLGLEADYFRPEGSDTGFIQIDPNQMDSYAIGEIDYSQLDTAVGVALMSIGPSGSRVQSLYSGGTGVGSYTGAPIDPSVLAESRFLVEGLDAIVYPTATVFDVSALAQQNPALASMPIQKFMDYYVAVLAYIGTGNRMFSESQVGGLDKAFILNELYGLPFKQNLWASWQMYLEEFVKVSGVDGPTTALNELHGGDSNKTNWNPGGKYWSDPVPEKSRYDFTILANQGFGSFSTNTGWLYDAVYGGTNLGKVMTNASVLNPFVAMAGTQDKRIQDTFRTAHDDALNRLVSRYMLGFPIQVWLPDWLKDQYGYFLGDILGSVAGDNRGKTPALDYIADSLKANADSVGSITFDFRGVTQSQNPVWNSENRTEQSKGVLNAIGYVSDFTFGKEPQSPFEYPVEQGFEQVKVKYIKGLLAALADDILGDYPMLQMLGLEHLMFRDEGRDYSGSPCYPDLDLPAHPYYSTSAQVYPDFYMWNIYEDGGALGPDQLGAIQEQVEFIVENCYNSMKTMSQGSRYDERTQQQVPELSVDNPIVITTKMTPEGTDGQADGTGHMDSPFAPSKAAKAATEKWAKDVGDGGWFTRGSRGTELHSTVPSEYLEGIRLSNTEGLFGQNASRQYLARTDDAHYDILKDQFKKTKHMFGSSEGYLNQELNTKNAPSVFSQTPGTRLERPSEAAHNFDLASLKQLARDSSKDLISQKMSMKRAFPTFKLFFVEEDEFETRFLNFDDFYSYNAVKEMTVVQSRKIAADHAIVVLQNISGTLDGTRRNVIADLDYFSESETGSSAKQKLESHGDTTSSPVDGDPITTGTASEQPFGAVVLRPGLNVQLRMGFSNSADSLTVMLSGRVVDVTWNTTGDLAEIMIQSFGAELEQVIKGTERNGGRTFSTTHELLGSMMLEPEVVHFGRWEFGQQFQVGEAKDFRLDFTEYSREGYLGKFQVTSWISQWMMDNPAITFGAAVVLSAATLLPLGRVFGGASKLASKVPGLSRLAPGLANVGATRSLGAAGYIAEFSVADDLARRAAIVTAGERLAQMSTKAATGFGKEGAIAFEKVVAEKAALALTEFSKATNVVEEAAAYAKLEQFIQWTVFKGKWMSKPWIELTGATFLTAAGPKFAGSLVGTALGGPLTLTAAAIGSAAIVDTIISQMLTPIYDATIGGTRKFFARTNATMFLTPQDDNLFPPHPKDYMTLDKGLIRQWSEGLFLGVGGLAGVGPEQVQLVNDFLFPDTLLSKKVDPLDCQYQLVSTSIWGVFHEMTLRHPGWVFGTRPYGNKYQYTMFFGLPAQRYWARPASNGFITRVNQLYKYLNTEIGGATNEQSINEYEFKTLYGDETFNQLREQVSNQDLPNTGSAFTSALPTNKIRTPPQKSTGRSSGRTFTVDPQAAARAALQTQMTAIALAEYLRAVQIRFEPFRRYHLFTSERDIVWNGIMGSENAVINAVDVTYFPSIGDRTDPANSQIRTAVFKAHSYIPESKLRIAPVRWYNCLGYGMAQRYAMGELCDRMRDMYRGEFIVLGNPRIRPLDIGIIVDSYNNMLGPIEVEQVVHTYSHETGYITEIKPSAVIYANEISGWPLMEAMKIYALAVQDIHSRYAGVKADNGSEGSDPGSLATAASVIAALPGLGGLTGGSSKYDSFIKEKYGKIFGEDKAGIQDMWGSAPALNLDGVEQKINELYKTGATIATGIGVAGAASTMVGGLGLLKIAGEAGGDATQMLKIFRKKPLALAYGAGLILGVGGMTAGFGAPLALSQVDFPGLAFLIGNNVLFLQCLRNDAIILVPLIKSGTPIVAGLAFNDPALMWNNFRGVLNRTFTETLTGTTNMLELYKRYGSEIWTRLSDQDLGQTAGSALYSSRPRADVGEFVNPPILNGLLGD